MFKMFKYLAKSKVVLIAMILLLGIQAYTSLSLPEYTANIVNIGIQQNGIAQITPDEMRADTFDNLSLFLSDDDEKIFQGAYTQNSDGNYELNTKDQATIDQLNAMLGLPMVLLTELQDPSAMQGLEQGSSTSGTDTTTPPATGTTAPPATSTDTTAPPATDTDTTAPPATGTDASGQAQQIPSLDQLKAALSSGQMTKADFIKNVVTPAQETLKKQTGDMYDSTINQLAVTFVKNEYEAMGKDMGSYQTGYILRAGGIMLGLTLVGMIAAIFVGLFSSRTAAIAARDLRSRLFKKVVSFSHSEMDSFSTASLITRSTNDIQQIQMVLVMIPRMVFYAPILGIGGLIKVMQTDTNMTWIIAVGVGSVLLIVLSLVIMVMPKFKKMQSLVDRLNLVSREILTGLLVIRAFSREKHEEERFADANEDLMKNQLYTTRAMAIMMPAMMLVMNGISVLIVWVGAHAIDIGELQVGTMMAFITYTMQIIMSFLMLSMISIMLPRSIVAAGRVEEVLSVEPAIEDKAQTLDDSKTEWKGVIRFDDVFFQYPNADEDALEHISFTANPGKTTAIIGGTGSGKTTLLHLIPRFYDVTKGKITFDGVDIRDLSQHKLREMLGYVPQKGVLFSGDIESNIKFAGDHKVTDEEMMKAAEIAQALDFIEDKDMKFQSHIAQGGTNVSGGQKQRLSIARAIAAQPKVFLFDDSFSALDYKTDATLRRAIAKDIKDATIIIVAQRVGTILHADQIIVLDDGKIVGMGTHEELLQTCEPYLEIAKSQLSEKELKGGKS